MSRGLVITTKLGKPVDPRNFYSPTCTTGYCAEV